MSQEQKLSCLEWPKRSLWNIEGALDEAWGVK